MDSLLEPEDSLRQEYLRAPWGELGRSATLGVVSLISKAVLKVMNSTHVENLETFTDHVLNRQEGVGLITVSNHTRCVRSFRARSALAFPPPVLHAVSSERTNSSIFSQKWLFFFIIFFSPHAALWTTPCC